MESITQAMNNIILDEEEEGGIAIEGENTLENVENTYGCDAKLCLVGRFLTEGVFDFQAMQQTMAALWRPGKGVYIRELGVNLFLFQFYHEIDIRRVLEGNPWTFNRKVLIISRMQEGVNPRCVSLNSIDLWVQVYDLQPGFMSEKVLTKVGNQMRTFVSSCPSNFKGVWREYMRIRVTIDLSKPLKRRIKIRKSGNEWFWIHFKYENVSMFCFICGILGHVEKYCSQIFDKPENEIIRPYGIWMKAPLRRQNRLIGAKWLRNGEEESQTNMDAEGSSRKQNPGESGIGANLGTENLGGQVGGENFANLNSNVSIRGDKSEKGGKRIVIVENKKRTNMGQTLGLNTEIEASSEEEGLANMDQDMENGSKNEFGAGSGDRARLSL